MTLEQSLDLDLEALDSLETPDDAHWGAAAGVLFTAGLFIGYAVVAT